MFVFAIFLLVQVATCSLGADTPISAATTFRVVSLLEVSAPDGSKSRFKLDELYSQTQSRAVVRLKVLQWLPSKQTDNKPKDGTYFVFANEGEWLVEESNGQCGSTTFFEFNKLLGLEEIPVEESRGHLVGSARLLLYLKANSQQMQVSGTKLEVRNRKLTSYLLKSSATSSGRELKFGAVYDENRLRDQNDPLSSLPTKASLFDGPLGFDVQVDTLSVEILEEDNSIKHLLANEALDLFALDPKSKCVELMFSVKRPFNLLPHEEASSSTQTRDRFSFWAEIETSNQLGFSHKRRVFVAYDRRLRNMRIDTRELDSQKRNYIHIINFELNLRFSIMMSSLRDASGGQQSVGGCISLPASQEPIEVFIFNLLLGPERLSNLGKAKVRGLDANVFARHTDKIPFWLGESGAKTSEETEKREDKYLVVAYVGSKHKQLLMLQVESFGENGNTVERQTIQVFDFMWTLGAQAPDGTPLNNLFSLDSYCPVGNGKRSQVEMFVQSTKACKAKAREALESYKERTFGLLTSLRRHALLEPNLISDFSSRFVKTKFPNSVGLLMSFRVAENVPKLASVEYTNKGVF